MDDKVMNKKEGFEEQLSPSLIYECERSIVKKRVMVFSHYDMHDVVDDYVYFYLESLRSYVDKIVFVSTVNNLTIKELNKLKKYVDDIIVRENIGYDFMSFKIGLKSLEPNYYDEIILCNDSVYGPVCSLDDMFKKMDKTCCDMWGITVNKNGGYHLQSYFLVFKKNLIDSKEFIKFWDNVKIIENKQQIIKQYEIGISQCFLKAGYKLESYIPYKIHWNEYIKYFSLSKFSLFYIKTVILDTLYLLKRKKTKKSYTSGNMTMEYWRESLIHFNTPVIKIMLFRKYVEGKENILLFLEKISSYPTSLIRKHLERVYDIS